MEALDSSAPVMDVDAAVDSDSVDASARCAAAGADRANHPGNEAIVNNNLNHVDNADLTGTAKDEDVAGGVVMRKGIDPTSPTIADSVADVESADAEDSADSADLTDTTEIDDSTAQSAKGERTNRESDSDSTNERTCLEAMTTDGQEYYLRLGDTPRRRSALRLSRIIARHQLLRRLSQGRNEDSANVLVMCLAEKG